LTLRSININIYLYISLAGYTSYQLMTDAEELHLGKKRWECVLCITYRFYLFTNFVYANTIFHSGMCFYYASL